MDGPRLEFANDPVNRRHNKKHGYYGRPLREIAEELKEDYALTVEVLNETSELNFKR